MASTMLPKPKTIESPILLFVETLSEANCDLRGSHLGKSHQLFLPSGSHKSLYHTSQDPLETVQQKAQSGCLDETFDLQ